MPIVLAGAAAATFGVADFLGGTAARRVPSAVVAVLAQVVGLVMLLALVLLALPAPPLMDALVWGALAGAAGGIGVPTLYRALAIGPMNVVAPLAALTSAVVPVLAGTLLGERPSTAGWVGIVLAVVAGTVVGAAVSPSSTPDEVAAHRPSVQRVTRGAALALFSGVCFGGFFTLIAQAPSEAGLWPVTVAKLTGTLVAAAALLIAVHSGALRAEGTRLMSAAGWRLAALCGLLDAAANSLYLLAAQRGQLAIVGAIVGLYPASTVLLARLLHGERISGPQRIGLVLAASALVLVGTS